MAWCGALLQRRVAEWSSVSCLSCRPDWDVGQCHWHVCVASHQLQPFQGTLCFLELVLSVSQTRWSHCIRVTGSWASPSPAGSESLRGRVRNLSVTIICEAFVFLSQPTSVCQPPPSTAVQADCQIDELVLYSCTGVCSFKRAPPAVLP